MCMCFCVYISGACGYSWRSEEGVCVCVASPGIGVTSDCEPPDMDNEINSGHLKEQQVLLTTKPFLQPPETYFKGKLIHSHV